MNWKRPIYSALVATAMAAAPAAAQFGGNYGSAIAVGEGELFIGEPIDNYNPGLVHVFRMDGGTWTEAETLSAEDAAPDNSFGRSISVDGNTMLIGATTADSLRGAAYIFQKNGGEWTQAAKLEGSDITAGDALGKVVLLNGEEAFVATWGKDSARGAVYVFRKSGSNWTETAILSPEDGAPEDRFGSAIATDGERLYVGAAGKDSTRGAVYVYHQEAGAWAQDTVLQSRRLEPESELGTSLLVRDNHLLVGLPGMNNHSGAVGILERDTVSGTWAEVSLLQPFEGGFSRFGTDIATNGDEIWVAAPAANRGSGAIYRLQRDTEGGFSGAVKIKAPDLPRRAGFGAPIVVEGDVVVAGAGGVDYGEGAAVILSAAGDDWEVASVLKGEVRSLAAITGDEKECGGEGSVSIFECRGVDLLSFLPVSAIGGTRGIRLNDIWGWTDPETEREYALVGRMNGTSFVDVTDPVNPKYLGDLPMTEGAIANAWRDIKVYRNHAFIVADGAGDHGMQVFDLTRLRAVEGEPVTFTADALYDNIHSAHNIVIDTATGYAFSVGSGSGGETCGGGLHMIDIRTPKEPKFAGCYANASTGRASTGYTHDAQCVIYHGPDERYTGRQICLGANETALDIADVTDKDNPVTIGTASYPNVGYTHQGWLSEDQRYFYMDDELDELQGKVDGTRTLVWDLAELDDPILVKEYISENKSSDHNLYVKGNFVYQSNYVSGLRLLNISDPVNPVAAGYFDTVPAGEDTPGFGGSWSNYPYFPSGTVIVTSGSEGLFMLRKQPTALTP